MLILPLLDKLGTKPATALRLVGLVGFVFWATHTGYPANFHGRGLVTTILLVGAGVGWINWTVTTSGTSSSASGLTWDIFLMAACGGVMVGAETAGPGNVFVFVAAFAAGARVAFPKAFVISGAAIIAICIAWVVYDVGGLGILAYSLGLVATTFGGAQRRDSVLRREQAELLLAQSQRSHEEALRNAKLEESSRIAREIHDVLAHSLAGLTIQLEATAALIANGADSETILPRVQRAYELARDGLRETRLAVGALRGDAAQAVPAASRIDALVGDFRAAGGEIALDLDGARDGLSGPAGDAAVRIIQESLTNVNKHAPGANVSVAVTAGPPLSLTVQSRSGSAGAAPSSLSATGGGYGIAGMRERAEELGGSLATGPTPDGWLVSAVLGATET